MSNDYHSKPSDNVDMSKYSSYVKAKIYPSHIEGVGVSYKRHFRTKAEIQEEISKLNDLSLSQEEHDKKLEQLQKELESRSQIHPP